MSALIDPRTAALIRQLLTPFKNEIIRTKNELAEVKALCASRPRSVTEEIDAIQGRRIFYSLVAAQLFDATKDGQRGDTMTFLVSQDGPFIATHYPLVMWKPTAPTSATDFGRWRPVSTWPLPDQVLDTSIIDISYEMNDSGGQRNFQNLPVPAGLLSRPDNLIPFPVPTLYSSNTVVGFIPTYENILFDTSGEGGTAATQGQLIVAIPGYRIVNL